MSNATIEPVEGESTTPLETRFNVAQQELMKLMAFGLTPCHIPAEFWGGVLRRCSEANILKMKYLPMRILPMTSK